MKLSPREATGYFARPEPDRAGLLIYGNDAMRVALKRQQVIAALLGPNAEEEMRLTRLSAADLRADPAALTDAVKARGFFPGPRVVFLDEATDALADRILGALADWQKGDAQIVLTARQLPPKSALRKAFEAHPEAYAIGIYDDPPGRPEIEAMLAEAGLGTVDRAAMGTFLDLATALDPGDFRQTVEKVALYKLNDPAPLTPEDVAACAPRSTEAEADALIHAVAEAKTAEIGPLLRRLQAQGMAPVTLCIAATRHFRQLHAAAADPDGAASGINRLRPPVHFKARDRMVRQAQGWGMHRLEQALGLLLDTDLQLRSSQRAPQMALIERSLVKLAVLASRRA
ncbi:DNA polymerase III subunit delta [Rhodovulum sulfidophilum]|uniref:DNA-directed DNA polymerase n=1 Tax=Rhodovulum visakhapatnamense TaxID=364297 RepID=A0ABS1RAH4_9RHOB|nr:DNA polymerase III subunit delta [Rhodovulum visakhapatnamense]MBL3568222.1 DNA polymerase III subunit delta [Rhodovulum visakhapatnamense]MBL3576640.1 DNA polymerase III subunit delta [Rhodovulum visakhapatnamense]OLS43176.1 DNA polymerase III subunit delta [Rhodovulum sulfidophilum]